MIVFYIQNNTWSRWQSNKNCAPLSRKAHTAVVYDGKMYVYGGYQDMRGSLGELWQFSFGMETFMDGIYLLRKEKNLRLRDRHILKAKCLQSYIRNQYLEVDSW